MWKSRYYIVYIQLYEATNFQKFVVVFIRHPVYLIFLISHFGRILLSWLVEEPIKHNGFTGLEWWRSNVSTDQNLAGVGGVQGSTPSVSDSVELRWGPGICNSTTFPADAHTVDPGTTLKTTIIKNKNEINPHAQRALDFYYVLAIIPKCKTVLKDSDVQEEKFGVSDNSNT